MVTYVYRCIIAPAVQQAVHDVGLPEQTIAIASVAMECVTSLKKDNYPCGTEQGPHIFIFKKWIQCCRSATVL